MRPKSIVIFEALILGTLVIGIINTLASPNEQLRSAPTGFVLFVQGTVLAVMVALTLLISRRGSNIAKWISITLFLLGLPLYLKMVGEGSIELSIVQVFQTAMQTIGYALLFTPSARNWFKKS